MSSPPSTTRVRVADFLPSRYGLRFPNAFPPTPFLRVPGTSVGIGNAADGLCGGMTFMARDLFEHRLAPPVDVSPPREGPVFRYLVGRAIKSFDLPSGPAKYQLWMGLPDHSSFFGMSGVAWRTLAQEWPSVRADLDRGVPSPLGLIRTRSWNPMDLGKNHQVLAYGYDLRVDGEGRSQSLDVFVYDPNWPMRDDVAIHVALRTPLEASTVTYVENDAPVRAFFRSVYRVADPSAVSGGPAAPAPAATPASPAGNSPVATGRDGSEIQSDHEPT
jgi:hypothetical protein